MIHCLIEIGTRMAYIGKENFAVEKQGKKNGCFLRGAWTTYGGAKWSVIRPDISHAGNSISQTRNDIHASFSLFSCSLLSLNSCYLSLAAINASARTCNFERLLRPIRVLVIRRQFVRNPMKFPFSLVW